MRLVFGTGKITPLETGGYGLAFKRLHTPLVLLALKPEAMPDLSPYDGKLCQFNGLLDNKPGNLREPRAFFTLLRLLPPAEEAVTTEQTELTAIVSGNIGSTPSMNPSGDRFAASIPFAGTSREGENSTAWLQVATEFAKSEGPDAIAQAFSQIAQGTPLLVAGVLTSYVYKGSDGTEKPGMHVSVKGFDMLGTPGATKGKTLASAYTADEPTDGEVPF